MVLDVNQIHSQYKSVPDAKCQEAFVPENNVNPDSKPTHAEVSTTVKKDVYGKKSDFDKTFATFKGRKENQNKASIAFYRTINDCKRKLAAKKEWINFAASPFPMVRRIVNIKNNQEDDNSAKAIGLGAVAVINVQEDIRDLLSIAGRSKSSVPSGYYARYGFFIGTPVEKLLMKTATGEAILGKIDKTVSYYPLFDKIIKKLDVKPVISVFKRDITHLNGQVETVARKYVKLEGPKLARIAALTLFRMPQLSLFVSALLELPKILKTQKQDKGKQVVNSGLNVVVGTTCGAMLSAAAAVLVPQVVGLPVLALGLGYYLGSRIAKGIGFKLDSTK